MQCSTHTLADLQNTFLSLAESCHVLPLHAIQVLCAVVVAVNVAAALLASHILGLEDNLIIVNMTIFMALGTLFFAAQVEWFHSVITRQDKAGMIMFGILGTAASYSLMMLLPPGWVDLPVAAAVKEASDRLTSLVDKRFGDVGKQSFATSSDPVLLAVPLSVIGGFISGLFMAPGLRYGRLIQQALFPPMWSREYVSFTPGIKALLRLGFALPLVAVPLWVTPMTEVLLIGGAWLHWVRPLLLAGLAAVGFATITPLVQSFLYTALLNWYLVRHSGGALDDAARGRIMKQHIDIALCQTCKVAVQMSLVPVLLSAVAGLYILKSFPSGSKHADVLDQQPSVLYQVIAGFIGWWTCVTWSFYTSLAVVISRLGVTNSTTP
eukprot:jgi/Chrzof1/9938/Cz04g21120.t1